MRKAVQSEITFVAPNAKPRCLWPGTCKLPSVSRGNCSNHYQFHRIKIEVEKKYAWEHLERAGLAEPLQRNGEALIMRVLEQKGILVS